MLLTLALAALMTGWLTGKLGMVAFLEQSGIWHPPQLLVLNQSVLTELVQTMVPPGFTP